jgi:hypothetical protein
MKKLVNAGILAIVAMTLVAGLVLAPLSTSAREFEGFGDYGQPPIVHLFYLNESGSQGVTNDMWGASVNNIRLNYRFLSMGGIDKVMYSVWRTQGSCNIANPNMSGGCIPGQMMKMLSEDVIQHSGVEGEEYNKPIYVSPGKPYTDGTYVVIMSAITNEGFINSTSERWFGIDQTAPVAPTLSTPANNAKFAENTNINFKWTTTDTDIYQYEIKIGDQAAQKITTTEYNKVLAPGNYSWKVRGIDKVGNVGPWSQERVLQVESTTYPEDSDFETDKDSPASGEALPKLPTPPAGPGMTTTVAPLPTTGTVAGTQSPLVTRTGMISETAATDENIDAEDEPDESEGDILGAEDENIQASAAAQIERGWLGQLIRSWLFWLLVAIIAGFLIWYWRRRRQENKDLEEFDK